MKTQISVPVDRLNIVDGMLKLELDVTVLENGAIEVSAVLPTGESKLQVNKERQIVVDNRSFDLTRRQYDAVNILFKADYKMDAKTFYEKYKGEKIDQTKKMNPITRLGGIISNLNNGFAKKGVPLKITLKNSFYHLQVI